VRFTDEPVAVDVSFDAEGAVRPRRFIWNQAWRDVSDIGRQWEDEAGRHVLVMVGGRQTFEMLLERKSLIWRVVRAPDDVVGA
jgi:hypothetical protein